jgi:hypothetical protein
MPLFTTGGRTELMTTFAHVEVMSALPPKRTCAVQLGMSARRKKDSQLIRGQGKRRHVRQEANSDSATLQSQVWIAGG